MLTRLIPGAVFRPSSALSWGAPSRSTVLTLDAFNGRITPTSTAATLRMRDFSLLY